MYRAGSTRSSTESLPPNGQSVEAFPDRVRDLTRYDALSRGGCLGLLKRRGPAETPGVQRGVRLAGLASSLVTSREGTDDVRAIAFSVDSHLLRELGERLVGKPHIALAELIKNSYDADATVVRIGFHNRTLTVEDDGHGMTLDEFTRRWMRVGSTHKEVEGFSRKGRSLTGSKGVGRLAVQLLADELTLVTTAMEGGRRRTLSAHVDWTKAVDAGLLTEATADVTEMKTCDAPGTTLRLTGLRQEWTADLFTALARELWTLQPPFRAHAGFSVELVSDDDEVVASFQSQMTAIFRIWSARLRARLRPLEPGDEVSFSLDHVEVDQEDPSDRPDDRPPASPGFPRVLDLVLEFADGERVDLSYAMHQCHLDRLNFEIRVFNLKNRQPFGLSVHAARGYLAQYGGVHVYDSDFHLPYYGADIDWLRIEYDHSHRRSASKLLPVELGVSGGMEYLPTNGRIYGVVEVSTNHEQRVAKGKDQAAARDALMIQVSRDRLADTVAMRDLTLLVRSAVDFYAMREAERAYGRISSKVGAVTPLPEQAKALSEVLDHYRQDIPLEVHDDLSRRVSNLQESTRMERRKARADAALLGSLATAGINALAYEHEALKQYVELRALTDRLNEYAATLGDAGTVLREISRDITSWTERATATRALFNPLLDAESRSQARSWRAGKLMTAVFDQTRSLSRGAVLNCENIDISLTVPAGTFAQWSALLQNLVVNAFNAMLGVPNPRIDVSSYRRGAAAGLLIQDTGSGIDLAKAESYFRPFARHATTSADRAQLALGGTGLGLTIARVIADDLGCSVTFVRPDEGHRTAAQIEWET